MCEFMKKILSFILLILIFNSLIFTTVKSNAFLVDLTPEEVEFLQNNTEIRLGIDNDFPPYEFVDIDDVYKGICADYVALIEHYTGIDFVIPFPALTWTEVYDKAKETDEIDALACIGVTDERKEFFDFSEPYVAYERAIFSNTEETTTYSLEDLPNISVGVQKNSSHHSFLLDETSITPTTYDELEDALYSLSENNIDVLVGNLATTAYTIKQLNITNIEIDSIVSTEGNKLAFAVNKDMPLLTSIINKGLSSITQEEKLEINDKWIGITLQSDGVNLQRIFMIVGIIISVILIVVGLISWWNYQLQKVVRERTSELNEKVIELKESRIDLVHRLGKAAEYNDRDTGLHVVRVSNYSRILAKKIGLDEEKCEMIALVAPMHDVGKIGIEDSILKKPGKLSDAEFEKMKEHTSIGEIILFSEDKDNLLYHAAIMALEHHEKWNGTGYPNGLKGENINIIARICAIADVFDALTSARTYKKAWSFDEAYDFIVSEKSKHFDPKLVEAFEETKDQFFHIYTSLKD